MTPHDHMLSLGSDGTKELDEEAWDASIEDVADRLTEDDSGDKLVEVLYNAYPAIQAVFNGMCLGQHSTAFCELAKIASSIRAKVDDEYAARVTTYDDPRDGDE